MTFTERLDELREALYIAMLYWAEASMRAGRGRIARALSEEGNDYRRCQALLDEKEGY